MQNAELRNYLHLHFIVFIFGFTAILGELITLEAFSLVWYRMAIATVCIGIYAKLRSISLRISKKNTVYLSLAGIVIALHWVTFFAAIKASTISLTLAVLSSGAFFTSLLEPIVYKRKIVAYEVLLGLLVIAGLYIIFSVEQTYLEGMILAVISALLSSIFSLINGKFAHTYRPTVVSFYEIGAGTLFLSLYLLATSVSTSFELDSDFFSISKSDLFYIGILASVCTAYAFIGSVQVMKYLSPYTVMLTINLEPVYGIALAYFIFGDKEQMTTTFYFGALLILATVIANGIIKYYRKKNRNTASV